MTEVVVLTKHSVKHFIVYICALKLLPRKLLSYCQQHRVCYVLRLFGRMVLGKRLLLEMLLPLLEQNVKRL